MKLSDIKANLKAKLGITDLNPMQQEMASTDARNLLLLAPTGSGKTVAFALYVLKRVNPDNDTLQALIIAPSRELVLQITGVIRALATGCKVTPLYGGHPMVDETNALKVTPAVIVATPGRLLDHLQRRQVDVSRVAILVLDEYDKSLELGFADEMSRIVKRLKGLCNMVLTSATRLETLPEFLTADNVKTLDFTPAIQSPRQRLQVVEVASPMRDKVDTLAALLHSLDNGRVIVFVNHRESAERVYEFLKKQKFPVGMYHGGLEQRERQLALDLFDNGTTPVLVSTDLASRGLDIDAVNAVIHYHLPSSAEVWTHRNGRTARQDAHGTVYVITSEADSLPDYVKFDREYAPTGHSDNPLHSNLATLYINAGRREKISRGDIAGYLINRGGLTPGQVGKISVSDHSAFVAIPADKVKSVIAALAPFKLKNTRVKVTEIRP